MYIKIAISECGAANAQEMGGCDSEVHVTLERYALSYHAHTVRRQRDTQMKKRFGCK